MTAKQGLAARFWVPLFLGLAVLAFGISLALERFWAGAAFVVSGSVVLFLTVYFHRERSRG